MINEYKPNFTLNLLHLEMLSSQSTDSYKKMSRDYNITHRPKCMSTLLKFDCSIFQEAFLWLSFLNKFCWSILISAQFPLLDLENCGTRLRRS